jgi:hypothetical protein
LLLLIDDSFYNLSTSPGFLSIQGSCALSQSAKK